MKTKVSTAKMAHSFVDGEEKVNIVSIFIISFSFDKINQKRTTFIYLFDLIV